ncbi:MAG: SDR family NAD(P)-dependent oxidoreductase, partial [Sciscionella sp.]
MELSLKGRRAIVTGAARGIGRAIAGTFADAGADVAIIDRDRDGAEETAQRCADAGCVSTAHAADLTNA